MTAGDALFIFSKIIKVLVALLVSSKALVNFVLINSILKLLLTLVILVNQMN